MYKKKPTNRPFYPEANDKYKRSYDILDEQIGRASCRERV